jgi:formyl-CoA transferase
LLADLGARVLKVEAGQGDYSRELNPWVFNALNRNKRSIALDYRHPKGRKILLRLVSTHDVLLESFRPGVMDMLSLGYAAVKEVNQGIVYCSLTGYGQNGPYRHRSGHDLNYLSVAGVIGLTADGDERPSALPMPLADLAGSVMASHAILAALLARTRSGKGAYIDAAMTDAALSLMSPRLAVAKGTGKMSRRDLIRGGAYGLYRTLDGRFLSLGVIEDKFWKDLARAIGREELGEDPRFATDRMRSRNRDEIRALLEPIFSQKDLKTWLEICEREDVPAAPVNRLDDLENDLQIRHRGLLFDTEDETGRVIRNVDYAALFPEQPQYGNGAAPVLGNDTRQVLRELRYGDEQIDALETEGVVSMKKREGDGK